MLLRMHLPLKLSRTTWPPLAIAATNKACQPMKTWKRSLLVVAGLILAPLVVFVFEFLGALLWIVVLAVFIVTAISGYVFLSGLHDIPRLAISLGVAAVSSCAVAIGVLALPKLLDGRDPVHPDTAD